MLLKSCMLKKAFAMAYRHHMLSCPWEAFGPTFSTAFPATPRSIGLSGSLVTTTAQLLPRLTDIVAGR